jgi:CRP-like cAMP-binding protein
MTAAKPHAARTNSEGKAIANQLLLALPDAEFRMMRPHLSFVDLPGHLRLHNPHRTLNFVHFPNSGLISLVIEMSDGKSVEAGVLGKEGVSGTPALVGISKSPILEVVQIAGHGFRIKVSALREILLLQSAPRLQAILERYAAGLGMQMAQTAACNRLHGIEERLARWLLMAQDRVGSKTVRITQDFLATMLGTDRPTVTAAAGILKRQGLIRHSRGAVEIVSRRNLENFACECYAVVAQYNGG